MIQVFTAMDALHLNKLKEIVPEQVQMAVPLARYTAARLGGEADVLVTVRSADQLAGVMEVIWESGVPYTILGGGSNILVSDAGFRGVVILNRAGANRFMPAETPPLIWAESGTNFGLLARQAASKGLSGLEWGAGIPGTLGGAVVGNAGAHDSDMAGNLVLAEILHRNQGKENWPVDKLEYAYRTSWFKRHPGQAVVLSATLQMSVTDSHEIQARMEAFMDHRRRTQPPGASMGSMFKNPPGDYAGRLIEAAGLKSVRVGEAGISPLHANFFINYGGASAADVMTLIDLARQTVYDQSGIWLELEVELVGEWKHLPARENDER